MGAAVKAARALTGPAVLTSNGEGKHAKSRTKNGPAAIVTGVMSQLVTPGDTKFRSGFVLRAAVGKAPTHALSIAQAAAQAAFSISGTNYNRNSIVLPVADGGGGFSAAQIRNAATFGRSQALALVPGAGAAGVRNYQHRSGATDPIASLEGL